jgi:protein-L-isoaspartate(D-aspartate) O-methyltransferase
MNRNHTNGKSDKDWECERLRMVEDQLRKRGISDERVLHAMGKVPRHLFVPQESTNAAYTDGPVPIGEGQTVSQPYMVALMTQCLALTGAEKVLEIGTGSGYQSAVLMELVRELYTVERVHSLAERAEQQLLTLGYHHFHMKIADGTKGWPEEAPFDGIIVTAGAPAVPDVLLNQLKGNTSTLIIPVGTRYSQKLCKCSKTGNTYKREEDTMCVFVPLVGEHGWEEE